MEPAGPAFSLSLAGSNPAFGSAGYSFDLPATSAVELSLYDLRGRCVRRLLASELGPGGHAGVWDGTDDAGQPVGAGVYWYRLTAGPHSAVRKLLLLR